MKKKGRLAAAATEKDWLGELAKGIAGGEVAQPHFATEPAQEHLKDLRNPE